MVRIPPKSQKLRKKKPKQNLTEKGCHNWVKFKRKES